MKIRINDERWSNITVETLYSIKEGQKINDAFITNIVLWDGQSDYNTIDIDMSEYETELMYRKLGEILKARKKK